MKRFLIAVALCVLPTLVACAGNPRPGNGTTYPKEPPIRQHPSN